MSTDAVSRFSYSTDGTKFIPIGEPLPARAGRWIGAKIGLFALGTAPVTEYGYADDDWFRVEWTFACVKKLTNFADTPYFRK